MDASPRLDSELLVSSAVAITWSGVSRARPQELFDPAPVLRAIFPVTGWVRIVVADLWAWQVSADPVQLRTG